MVNMKTVGTKLDKSEYEIFEFCCNEQGLTKSTQLRNLIKTFVESNEQSTSESQEYKPTPEAIVKRISYDGETWYDVEPKVIIEDV